MNIYIDKKEQLKPSMPKDPRKSTPIKNDVVALPAKVFYKHEFEDFKQKTEEQLTELKTLVNGSDSVKVKLESFIDQTNKNMQNISSKMLEYLDTLNSLKSKVEHLETFF